MNSSTTITEARSREEAELAACRNWWAPIWQGLVLDEEGRHYKQMGSAIWLFAYFILCADRQTGTLKRKAATISRQMGVKVRTIRAWFNVLRLGGYIETTNGGRSLLIRIKKWKTYPQRHHDVRQSDIIVPIRVTELCQPEAVKKGQISAKVSQETVTAKNANDITLKKDILNVNVRGHPSSAVEEDILAREICQSFDDQENLALYQSYIRKYPREIIEKAFKEALKLPSKKIKKTRGALFTYLVKYYAEEKNNT